MKTSLALVAIALASLAGAQTTANIRVDLSQPKAAIPNTLHGIFMEEISHAFDGGIYAELIQNRSFEEGVMPEGLKLVKRPDGSLKMELKSLPEGVPEDRWPMPWPWGDNATWRPERELVGWSLFVDQSAKGDMKVTEANPMNAASSRSLALSVDAGKGRLALVNSGYWGINVQSGTSYKLKFFLRPGTFQGEVTASLESKDGKVLSRVELGKVSPSTDWKQFNATFKAKRTYPQARFVLSFAGKGDLQLDWVSLFPPTYKNRPNGLRPELAKYLEALKPSFVRYPGGCYVEGFSWESAPDWRTMVCPPEERPGTYGYWQYRSTDGFGYHEFLQFCEDIGSDAMYVAFAGMTVHPDNNMPLDKIGPVIQQTLDAIEYATGPVTSKWGAVRAKMGHPKPFRLKYVEIGNEHPPAIYGDYYKRFRDAIKAKYPKMQVIMSMFWSGLNPEAIARAGDDSIDIVDEHAYRDAAWIRTNFHYFDRYPRKPWSIYVGEYASHHGAGDWYGGMSDSVYLMMVERNADLVKMASYAPLFSNVNKKDWGINLIEFDSSRSFAHASYYVQKTFAENRPDFNLPTTYETAPKPDPKRALMTGKIGLGAWTTQTEFKDLRVYDEAGKLVAQDDFASLANWETPVTGQWKAEGGVLKQTSTDQTPAMILHKLPEFKTGKIMVKARRVGGTEGFLLFFNASGIDRFLFCNFGAAGNAFSAIQERGVPQGLAYQGGRSTGGAIENGRWYDISLTVGLDRAEVMLDGKVVSDARLVDLPSYFSNAGYDVKTGSVVLKVTNYGSKPVETTISLDGAKSVGSVGKHIVIRSEGMFDENSLDNPLKIVPVTMPLKGCAKEFKVTIPPFSVNVLRIPAKR